jgi:hypothetical protein
LAINSHLTLGQFYDFALCGDDFFETQFLVYADILGFLSSVLNRTLFARLSLAGSFGWFTVGWIGRPFTFVKRAIGAPTRGDGAIAE